MTTPEGNVEAYLVAPSSDTPIAKLDDAKKQLTRSAKSNYYPYYVFVEAEMQSARIKLIEAEKGVDEEAYKKKLSEAEKDKLLKAALQKVKTNASQNTCLSIKVQTDDSSANDSDSWHGALIAKGVEHALSFEKFVGFSNTVRTTQANQYYAGGPVTVSSYDTSTYYLYSTACAKSVVDLTQGFELRVEPRYKKEVKPMQMIWTIGTPFRRAY